MNFDKLRFYSMLMREYLGKYAIPSALSFGTILGLFRLKSTKREKI